MKHFLFAILLLLSYAVPAQEVTLERVEPPSWWTGFKNPEFQLLVYGRNIASATVSTDYPGFQIRKIHKVKNPNYLFLDVTLSPGTRPGMAVLLFRSKDKVAGKYLYELKERKKGSAGRPGFSSSDVIYLLMPDRFSNGDPANDDAAGMVEKANRSNPDGRHGGDILGIMNHLDYIRELGATTIWINPLLENNQAKYSYHGYSATDFYKTDPRFGTNEDYVKLSAAVHQMGMKLIMDQVFNHCGSQHWWMKDLPSSDWINEWPEYTPSTYRSGSVTDPWVSRSDSARFVCGWFDRTMPDLNQRNPYVRNYLIQNSIWWVEYASLDGIRQDTYAYPFKEIMAEWGKRMLEEYPNFNIVGECWMNYPATVAYWQKDARNGDGFNSFLPSVFDFPLHDALIKAFNEKESWDTGILRLYEILSQDFSYPAPHNIVTFADNHDVNRFLDTQGDDIRKLKMAMAFLLTTRGIPQVYYGTEILLSTGVDKGHGSIRKDFPGGWSGDTLNAFKPEGRSEAQQDMYTFMHTLLNWRKSKEVITKGKLTHFIPSEGVYTYFRYNDKETVMVILNNNNETKTIEPGKYGEFMKNVKTGRDVISGAEFGDFTYLTIPSKSAMVLELQK